MLAWILLGFGNWMWLQGLTNVLIRHLPQHSSMGRIHVQLRALAKGCS